MLFSFPQAIWISLIIPFFIGLIFRLERYRKFQIEAYASQEVRESILTKRSAISHFASMFLMLIWFLMSLALMGPFKYQTSKKISSDSENEKRAILHEVAFLVDISASMRVVEEGSKSRLEECKILIEDILTHLQGEEISLYALTTELTPIVPATYDYLFFRMALNGLEVNQEGVKGTQFSSAFTGLEKEIFSKSKKEYTLLLFSDGGDNLVEKAPAHQKNAEMQKITNALLDPNIYHFSLITVGLGSTIAQKIPHVQDRGEPVFSKQENEILKMLAEKGKGKYYSANEESNWNLSLEISQQINKGSYFVNVPKETEDLKEKLYYQIPLGIAIFFYFFYFLFAQFYG